jgi:hypothetical protein
LFGRQNPEKRIEDVFAVDVQSLLVDAFSGHRFFFIEIILHHVDDQKSGFIAREGVHKPAPVEATSLRIPFSL